VPLECIPPFQKKVYHVQAWQGRLTSYFTSYLLLVNTVTLVNNCARGGGGSCVVRVCVYIYINCPLKNVTQLGYVLQGILMRCVLHLWV